MLHPMSLGPTRPGALRMRRPKSSPSRATVCEENGAARWHLCRALGHIKGKGSG